MTKVFASGAIGRCELLRDRQGYFVNFVDPDLVGKPAKPGSYKTASPIILNLGSKYLLRFTILCDEIDGADYKDSMAVVESMRIKSE